MSRSPPARPDSRSSRPATPPRRRRSRLGRRRRAPPSVRRRRSVSSSPARRVRRRRATGCRRRSSWWRRRPKRARAASPGRRASRSKSPATPTSRPAPSTPSKPPTEPVRITFWHTMQSAAGDALAALTDEYNASQDRVVVELQNQNGYEELIDKYFQSSPGDRPHLAQLPEYMLQQMADTNTVVTTTACIQTEGFDISPFLPRAMFAYQTGGVQWAMPFNISSPVLYYNKAVFEEAGLDPDAPADHPRRPPRVLAADRRLRCRDLRPGPRLGSQLRWWLVPRAVARPCRPALRRQRQRPHRPRHPGAVQLARGGGDADVRPGSRRRRSRRLRRRRPARARRAAADRRSRSSRRR